MSDRDEILALNALSADAYWSVNKALARMYGIENAVFITELLYKFKYWKAKRMLDNERGFFLTSPDIQAVLGVSERAAKRLTKSIQDTKLVKVKKRGTPAKNYWYIQFKPLLAVLTSEAETVLTGEYDSEPTSEAETVPAITKKTDEENISMLPQPFKESKPKKARSKTINHYPEIDSLLNILLDNGEKLSTISQNMRRLMFNAVEAHGLEFCEQALRGRIVQASRKRTGLSLNAFFDPEAGQWMSDCAKLVIAPTVKAQSTLTPDQEREYTEMSHRVPA